MGPEIGRPFRSAPNLFAGACASSFPETKAALQAPPSRLSRRPGGSIHEGCILPDSPPPPWPSPASCQRPLGRLFLVGRRFHREGGRHQRRWPGGRPQWGNGGGGVWPGLCCRTMAESGLREGVWRARPCLTMDSGTDAARNGIDGCLFVFGSVALPCGRCCTGDHDFFFLPHLRLRLCLCQRARSSPEAAPVVRILQRKLQCIPSVALVPGCRSGKDGCALASMMPLLLSTLRPISPSHSPRCLRYVLTHPPSRTLPRPLGRTRKKTGARNS